MLASRREMANRGRGKSCCWASLTSFQPSPSYAAYAASKSFLRSLGEALRVAICDRSERAPVWLKHASAEEFFRARMPRSYAAGASSDEDRIVSGLHSSPIASARRGESKETATLACGNAVFRRGFGWTLNFRLWTLNARPCRVSRRRRASTLAHTTAGSWSAWRTLALAAPGCRDLHPSPPSS